MNAEESNELVREPVNIAVLDGLAEAQEDGKPNLVVELIDLYLADTSRRVDAMRDALTTTDGLLLARAAHALKGSSSTLGAGQVAESCEELERLAGDLAFGRSCVVLKRLERELRMVRDTFLTERQRRSGLAAITGCQKCESGDVLTPPPLS